MKRGISAFCFATLAAAGAMLASPLAAAAVVAGASCTQAVDPYGASQSQQESCGDHVFPRIATERKPDGSAQYRYNVAGLETTYVVPPASFNPAGASAEELERYGIPAPPPLGSPQVAMWQRMIDNMVAQAPPEHLVTLPVQVLPTAAESTSSNWAGYINDASSQVFNQSTGYYVEPSDHGTSCSNNSAVTWTGLGGWNSRQLAQSGTGINTPDLGQHQAWSEVLPSQGSIVPQNLYGTAGSYFLSETKYVTSTEFHFYMYNYANGHYLSYYVQVGRNGYDGSTSDFVAERPTYNGSLRALTNYGTIPFQAYTNDHPLTTYGHRSIEMLNGNKLLAQPGPVSGSEDFTDYHYACS